MSLGTLQREFMGCLLDGDQPLPPAWDTRFVEGLAVYRNAYRARLVAALEETFPRTARWVGDEAFAAAAAHHLIAHPSADWTLDTAGRGFEATLAALFASDPEVAELAWFEWAMHRTYVAADAVPLDPSGFAAASAGFVEEDWATMRLGFVPSLRLAPVRHDCVSLWRALQADTVPGTPPPFDGRAFCIVWRDGLKPVCRLAPANEGDALLALQGGATYGEACATLAAKFGEDAAAREAGAMLAHWLAQGLVARLDPCFPREIR